MEVLQLSLDGTDPSVGLVTDTAAISKINEEIGIITLPLDIAKLEQVAITKQLFEQKRYAKKVFSRFLRESSKAVVTRESPCKYRLYKGEQRENHAI